MKRLLSFLLLFVICLFSCGGTGITFSAYFISRSPEKVEKTIKIRGYEFIYYNVYNDGKGNFVLADNTSYIKNTDMNFGIRFQSRDGIVCIYDENGETTLETISKSYDNGDWGYQVDSGFLICVDKSIAMTYTDINIGKITHWC